VNQIKTLLALLALGGTAYAVYLQIHGQAWEIPWEQLAFLSLPAGETGPLSPPVVAPNTTDAAAPVFLTPNENGPHVGGPSALAPQAAASVLAPSDLDANPTAPFADNQPARGMPNDPRNEPSPSGPSAEDQTADTAEPDPAARVAFETAKAQAGELLQAGRLKEALALLTEWYEWDGRPRVHAAERMPLYDLLGQLAGTVIYSRDHWLEPPHVVQNGENLEDIARQYQVSSALLAKINGLSNPRFLPSGTRLKVLRGPFQAIVQPSRFCLVLKIQDLYAGVFPIGIGRDVPLPRGELIVQLHVLNPPYYGPDGTSFAASDPQNPYGKRWIDLGGHFGLHGTNDPNLIGRENARGCLALHPRDLDDLADLLSLGSRVTILDENAGPLANRAAGDPSDRNRK